MIIFMDVRQVGHEKKVFFGRQWALKDVGIWNP
jgi:hypothetical protein